MQLLGNVTDLYFGGDMEASVANTGQESSRITELLPVANIVRRTWADVEAALDAARGRIYGDLAPGTSTRACMIQPVESACTIRSDLVWATTK